MNATRLYSIASLACIALSAAGAARWQRAVPTSSYQSDALSFPAKAPAASMDSALAEAEDVIVANDPFRLANAPAGVRYDPENENGLGGSAGASVPIRIRPAMTLKAIVGGPPWQAIVDGIPGQPPNAIVRAGNTFDKLVARAVTRDSVVIQGPDTTWVLSFRRQP